MGKYTLRPNGTNAAVTRKCAIYGGAASAHAALSDNADATYVERSADGSPLVLLDLGTTAITGDIVGAVGNVRLKKSDGTKWAKWAVARAWGSQVSYGTWRQNAALVPAIATTALGADALDTLVPGLATAWTQADVDALCLALDDPENKGGSSRLTSFYEAYVDVYSLARPTCSVTVEQATPIFETSFPNFDVTVSAIVESWQSVTGGFAFGELPVHVAVFEESVYAGVGFDPTTNTDYVEKATLSASITNYIDGTTPSTANVPWQPSTPLGPTGVYRLYVWAQRDASLPNGTPAFVEFEMSITPIDTFRTASALYSSLIVGVQVAVGVNESLGHSEPYVDIQRSKDGGVTWEYMRRGTHEPLPAFGWTESYLDTELPRGVTLHYRYRIETLYDGQRLTTDWQTIGSVSVPNDGKWHFHAIDMEEDGNAFLNDVLNAQVIGPLEEQQEEEVGVFRPLGRTLPVVIHGDLYGVDGTYRVYSLSAAEWAKWVNLLSLQEPVFVQTPFGDHKYVEFIGTRSWIRRGTLTQPKRELTLPYVEVERPAG